MKMLVTLTTVLSQMALMILISGCATVATNNMEIAKSQKQMALTQAGFKVHPIATDKQKQQVQALAQDKVSRAKHNGKTFYVYPDLANNQVFTGNRAQYQAYKQAQTTAAAQNSGINIDPDPTGIAINEFDGWGPGPLAPIDGY